MHEPMTWASSMAEQELAAELPRRWAHVQAVGSKAASIAWSLPPADRDVLVAAAWLHDIGYSSGIARTGFHPLDGARWLRDRRLDPRVVALVAHHTCAMVEAHERGLAAELAAEFPLERSETADALWYCDLTTGPDGQAYDVVDRLDEIRIRYGPGEIVTRFIDRAQDQLVAAVRRTESRLSVAIADRGEVGPAASEP